MFALIHSHKCSLSIWYVKNNIPLKVYLYIPLVEIELLEWSELFSRINKLPKLILKGDRISEWTNAHRKNRADYQRALSPQE